MRGKVMDKKPLIVVSICAVVLLVLGSLSNVVGYQSVQVSKQNTINNEVNQRELLFQTIIDIANNKDIQRIILKSQISRGDFFNPDVKFPTFNTPILTKNQLKYMYVVGLMLSKIISKSKIHSMVEQYQLNNQGVQEEISAIIDKDTTFNREINQLSNSECDCENNDATSWNFPVLCLILYAIISFIFIAGIFGLNFNNLYFFVEYIGNQLNCFYSPSIP